MREPVRCRTTGLWLARYVDAGGAVRQAGRFVAKSDARAAIRAAEGRASAAPREAGVSLLEFSSEWEERFPRHPRTMQTNRERLERYIFPRLPRRGKVALSEIRRSMLRDMQGQLLRKGLAKETIDGAFSSLSTLLGDAIEDELIDANPASRFRVRVSDPRLDPRRPPRVRRSITMEEVHAFMRCVPPRWRALCWAPLMTGARPGELFAMDLADVNRARQLIYLHRTVDRYGHLQEGLKTTHHIRDKQRRGRSTLFPEPLLQALQEEPCLLGGWLFPSPLGKFWGLRNFYRTVWDPARRASGTSFTPPASRRPRCLPGWGTHSAQAACS
jgi:integrase